MLPRLFALATLLLAFTLAPLPAQAQQAEVQHLEQALDDLEVVEALIQGKVTNATRDQAMQQLRDARIQIQAVQAQLMKAHPPVPPPPAPGGATVSVTEGPGTTTGSVQVGGPGGSLNINLTVTDSSEPVPPILIPSVTTAPAPPPLLPAPPPLLPAKRSMPPAAFATLRGAIQTESFSDGKLRVLRGALDAHMLDVAQAKQLLPLFDFSSDRVEAAVTIHPRLVDPQNFYELYGSFDFDSDKEEVRKKLGL